MSFSVLWLLYVQNIFLILKILNRQSWALRWSRWNFFLAHGTHLVWKIEEWTGKFADDDVFRRNQIEQVCHLPLLRRPWSLQEFWRPVIPLHSSNGPNAHPHIHHKKIPNAVVPHWRCWLDKETRTWPPRKRLSNAAVHRIWSMPKPARLLKLASNTITNRRREEDWHHGRQKAAGGLRQRSVHTVRIQIQIRIRFRFRFRFRTRSWNRPKKAENSQQERSRRRQHAWQSRLLRRRRRWRRAQSQWQQPTWRPLRLRRLLRKWPQPAEERRPWRCYKGAPLRTSRRVQRTPLPGAPTAQLTTSAHCSTCYLSFCVPIIKYRQEWHEGVWRGRAV